MKQHVARSSAGAGRGISQQIAAVRIIVKPDYDRLARAVRQFKFPSLYTLDDLLPICGLSTQADRVHLARALRRAGIAPLRGKKITLTDIVSGARLRSYIWCTGEVPADLRTAGQIRREYWKQRYVKRKTTALELANSVQKLVQAR